MGFITTKRLIILAVATATFFPWSSVVSISECHIMTLSRNDVLFVQPWNYERIGICSDAYAHERCHCSELGSSTDDHAHDEIPNTSLRASTKKRKTTRKLRRRRLRASKRRNR